jgi:hypothetical protein
MKYATTITKLPIIAATSTTDSNKMGATLGLFRDLLSAGTSLFGGLTSAFTTFNSLKHPTGS